MTHGIIIPPSLVEPLYKYLNTPNYIMKTQMIGPWETSLFLDNVLI